ncbi:hypothetical protein C8J56DRAFT_32952 [Mycena floridula]|nr:hypothetical protein C8J56DRAFT_32952 [Mycena floridula]
MHVGNLNQLRVTEQAEKEMTDKHGSLRYLPSSHIRSLNHHLLRPNPPLGVDAGGSKKSRALRYPVRGDYAAEEDGSPVPGSEESGHPSRDRKKTNACGDGRTRHMPRRMPGTARCRKRRKIEFSPNTDQHVFLPDGLERSPMASISISYNVKSTTRHPFQSRALKYPI